MICDFSRYLSKCYWLSGPLAIARVRAGSQVSRPEPVSAGLLRRLNDLLRSGEDNRDLQRVDSNTLENLSVKMLELLNTLRAQVAAQAEKFGRPPTSLELCLYFHTKDHDSVTFLDSRVEKIVTAIRRRRIELTQSQSDTPIDETELYLFVIERGDKGRTYGLGWTSSGSRRRHATAGGAGGGAGGGNGAGSSRPISSPYEPVELLWRDFQAMQTHILQVMQDHTLTQDQLREVQGQLNRMEQALMDRLKISFMPAPPRDVPADESETDDDLDD
ncbi:hypothetical protein Scep_024293 [Stephania cephalantha]|uniref:Uncharacterized protein n=1 Tax=Stephania cephalantha TaxID=152367 RepID=A0AAP0F1R7_9MAGN